MNQIAISIHVCPDWDKTVDSVKSVSNSLWPVITLCRLCSRHEVGSCPVSSLVTICCPSLQTSSAWLQLQFLNQVNKASFKVFLSLCSEDQWRTMPPIKTIVDMEAWRYLLQLACFFFPLLSQFSDLKLCKTTGFLTLADGYQLTHLLHCFWILYIILPNISRL